MMLAGNTGGGDGGDRGDGKKPSERDKLQFTICDFLSDDFKKTWLRLKELHDEELRHLHAKLTSMRKEQLAEGRWASCIAKIKELTDEQKVLKDTIKNLTDQLSRKTCNRCLMNETDRNTLQQEFYDVQQKNLKFIAELTAERNKLREENKQLLARLKSHQEQDHVSFTDSDDFIPCSQRAVPVFSIREPPQGTQMPAPIKLPKQSQADLPESEGRQELQQSSNFSPLLYSQDLFEVPETPSEKTSSNGKKPTTGDSVNQIWGFPLTPQRGYGFQVAANTPEDKVGQPKGKYEMKTSTQKTSTQKRDTRLDFSWSLCSISPISPADKLNTPIVCETPEEKMPGRNRNTFPPSKQKKEDPPLNVLSLDHAVRSSRKRSFAHYIGFEVRDNTDQTLLNKQCALKRNTNEPTGTWFAADKPQDDTESTVGSTLKRKARMQSNKKR